MRRCYLVCYDIREPRRLRRVHKVMKGYGEAWQFSVFFCVLKAIDLVRLQADLKKEMNLKQDQAMIVDLGNEEEEARNEVITIGQRLPEQEERVVVI